jgi:hypothetical protein
LAHSRRRRPGRGAGRSGKSCQPNIHVIFTDQPPALLEAYEKDPYIWAIMPQAQADALAKVTGGPILYAPRPGMCVVRCIDSHNSGSTMVEFPSASFHPVTVSTIKLPNAQVFYHRRRLATARAAPSIMCWWWPIQ